MNEIKLPIYYFAIFPYQKLVWLLPWLRLWGNVFSFLKFTRYISWIFIITSITDYKRSMKPFVIEIQNFWAWADKFLGIWGYFRMNYQHLFWYNESFVHVFHCSTIISTKIPVFISTFQIFIWDWVFKLSHKSQASNIAFLLDIARMSDLDFG